MEHVDVTHHPITEQASMRHLLQERGGKMRQTLQDISGHVGGSLGIHFGWELITEDGKRNLSTAEKANTFTGRGLCDGASFALQEALTHTVGIPARVVSVQANIASMPSEHYIVETTDPVSKESLFLDPTYQQINPASSDEIAIIPQHELAKAYANGEREITTTSVQEKKATILAALRRYGFTQEDYEKLVAVFQ